MLSRSSLLTLLSCLLLVGSLGRSLSLPPVRAQETCDAEPGWLIASVPPPMAKPSAHPESDWPFYQAAWRQFLFAMQPDQNGQPRLLSSYQ